MSPRIIHAPLALIRSSLCPLSFTATKCRDLDHFTELVRDIPAIGDLEVGECVHYESIFPHSDHHRHRKLGCMHVTASYGLAPEDIEVLFGITTYAHRLDKSEGLPSDLKIMLTMNQLASHAGLSIGGGSATRRLQSRVFRLSYVKTTNSAVWHSEEKCHKAVENMGFFDIDDMSLLMEPWQPVTLQLNHRFVQLLRESPIVPFDLDELRSLTSPAKRRASMIFSREAWIGNSSQIYDADEFCIHQIGYAGQKGRRLHELRALLKEFEERDRIRPHAAWKSYFATPQKGPLKGRLCLRWDRGPAARSKALRTKPTALSTDEDALFDQIKVLRNRNGEALGIPAYRRLLKEHGREKIQKHTAIILTQQRLQPQSFAKGAVEALVNRIQHDYTAPDWYTEEANKTRLAAPQLPPSPQMKSIYNAMTLKP